MILFKRLKLFWKINQLKKRLNLKNNSRKLPLRAKRNPLGQQQKNNKKKLKKLKSTSYSNSPTNSTTRSIWKISKFAKLWPSLKKESQRLQKNPTGKRKWLKSGITLPKTLTVNLTLAPAVSKLTHNIRLFLESVATQASTASKKSYS